MGNVPETEPDDEYKFPQRLVVAYDISKISESQFQDLLTKALDIAPGMVKFNVFEGDQLVRDQHPKPRAG